MRGLKLVVLCIAAVTLLAGCCGLGSARKCYPYSIYDYSPPKVCGIPTTPVACEPCAPCPTYDLKGCR